MPSKTNKTWLIPLTLEVWESAAQQASFGPLADEAAFEAWLDGQLAARGYLGGLPKDLLHHLADAYAGAPFRDYSTVNQTAHRLQIGAAVLRRTGRSVDVRHDGLLLFAGLAHAHGAPALADEAFAALEEEASGARTAEARSRTRSELAARVGQLISDAAVRADDPLLGHPFHEILQFHEAQLFGRVMWIVAQALGAPGGRPLRHDLLRPQGLARAAVLESVSACVALLVADGPADPDERRLINALIAATGPSETEAAMLRAEVDAPESAEALAHQIQDPTLRHLVLRLLRLTIHVNGHYAPAEEAFFAELAARFDVGEEALAAYELEALEGYEHHARLFGELSFSSVARRLRQRLHDNFELAVRKHARALQDEIAETGELSHLLLKAGEMELTPEEKAQVRRQLADVLRAIPALAIFAAPGGTVLLPLMVKHLPFKILPSTFDRMDEL